VCMCACGCVCASSVLPLNGMIVSNWTWRDVSTGSPCPLNSTCSLQLTWRQWSFQVDVAIWFPLLIIGDRLFSGLRFRAVFIIITIFTASESLDSLLLFFFFSGFWVDLIFFRVVNWSMCSSASLICRWLFVVEITGQFPSRNVEIRVKWIKFNNNNKKKIQWLFGLN